MYNYYDAENSMYIRKSREKKEIKRIGVAAGISVIAYVIIQNIISLIIMVSPLGAIYNSDAAFGSALNVFISVFGILVPFGVAGYFLNKEKNTPIVDFKGPVSIPLMITGVAFGVFVCLAGNYVTTVFVGFMEQIGITLTSPDYLVPEDISGRIMYTVSIAVVPALVEEFAIRGVILQPLRKYGDKFAIIASALLFAIMHGNLIQAPFALIAGVGIAYAVCITNSIWTGVIIHFCNNFYSVVVEFLVADIQDENKLNSIYLAITIALYAIAILGSALFFIIKKQRKLVPSFTLINEKEKMSAFVFSIPMVIALLIMLSITSNYINFS